MTKQDTPSQLTKKIWYANMLRGKGLYFHAPYKNNGILIFKDKHHFLGYLLTTGDTEEYEECKKLTLSQIKKVKKDIMMNYELYTQVTNKEAINILARTLEKSFK